MESLTPCKPPPKTLFQRIHKKMGDYAASMEADKVYRTTCGPWERFEAVGADKVWNVCAKKGATIAVALKGLRR